jgi:tRNA ligase
MAGSSGKAHEAWTSEKHPSSTSALLASLYDLRDNNPKAVRATVHHYPTAIYAPDDKGEGSSSSRDRRITSWKMTEHLYFSASNQFPTLARGLFTEVIEEGDAVPEEAAKCEGVWSSSAQRQRIVARGYDKFFNIDEVDWTDVSCEAQRGVN